MNEETLQAQLSWTPVLEGAVPDASGSIVVGGMGGSALPAYATRFLDSAFPVVVHGDYDLPEHATANALYAAISYSGDTAETLSFAKAAKARGLPLAAITSGGDLLSFARDAGVPFITVPAGVQPRNALVYLLRALLALTGREDLLAALAAAPLDAVSAEQDAKELAGALPGALPLFYASRKNGFLARTFKIHLNESAKMPAFANVFPELNHNEMQSFDTAAPEALAALARFVLMTDTDDDARVARRMTVFTELMRERGRSVTELALVGATRAEKLVRAWFTAYRTAHLLAEARGVDPDTVPLVEDFKNRL